MPESAITIPIVAIAVVVVLPPLSDQEHAPPVDDLLDQPGAKPGGINALG